MANKYGEKYTRELLTEAVANSTSIAGVLRHLEIPMAGGTHAHISRKLKRLGIDTSHFLGLAHVRSRPSAHRLALHESGVAYACVACGIEAEWNGKPIILHVDHIDGNWLDNRKENLRFLCPNCHSQTPTFAGRFKNKKGP